MKRFLKVVAQGLALVLPLVVTVWLIVWIGGAAEEYLGKPLKERLGDRYVWGMGIVAGLVLAILVGVLARFWLVRTVVGLLERLVRRIPMVKTIYDSVRDLLAFVGGGKKTFNRAVLVRLPGTELQTVGFVTQESMEGIPSLEHMTDRVAVYISASYGFMGLTVLVPREDVEPLAMSVPDAMRFALTAGVSAGDEAAKPPAAGPGKEA
jgi:uncharacterized membrane protein